MRALTKVRWHVVKVCVRLLILAVFPTKSSSIQQHQPRKTLCAGIFMHTRSKSAARPQSGLMMNGALFSICSSSSRLGCVIDQSCAIEYARIHAEKILQNLEQKSNMIQRHTTCSCICAFGLIRYSFCRRSLQISARLAYPSLQVHSDAQISKPLEL